MLSKPYTITAEVMEKVEELTDDRGYTEFKHEGFEKITAKAVMVGVNGKKVWVPLSQIRQLDGELYVSEWIAKQSGI